MTKQHISLIFWPDVSLEIGMGHLMESIALAKYLGSERNCSKFLIPNFKPAIKILKRNSIPYSIFRGTSPKISDAEIKAGLVLIAHHWNSRLDELDRLRRAGAKIVLFNQRGREEISCDLLVNGSVVREWHDYIYRSPQPKVCLGPRYAILRDEIISAGKARIPRDRNRVLVTLGGGDPTGATLRVFKALKPILNDIKLELILGPSFPHEKKLMRLVGKKPHPNLEIDCGVTDMGRRLKRATVVLSSGGNTLYEAAHLGCPAIVLWEYPHEKVQGDAIERAETGICIGNGLKTPLTSIRREVVKLLGDSARRGRMATRGKRLVDGRGGSRIAEKTGTLSELLNRKTQ